jgi:hypothetical protein
MTENEENKFIADLRGSRATILDTLSYLGGLEDPEIPRSLEGIVIDLIDNEDSDIREQAVFVVGVHWRAIGGFKKIFNIVCSASDQEDVMLTAVTAIGAMLAVGLGDLIEASQCIARIVICETNDRYLRAVAYRVLLRVHKKISMQEYAAGAVHHKDIEKMAWDKSWVASLVGAI